MTTAVQDLEAQVSGLFDYITDTALVAARGVELPVVGNMLGDLLPIGVTFLDVLESQLIAKLDLLAPTATAAEIAAAIHSLNLSGIDATSSLNNVLIHIGVTDSMNLAQKPFGFEVGSKALGLVVDGNANLTLGYKVNLQLDFSTTSRALATGFGTQEVALTLGGSIDAIGEGHLGFLGVTMTDNYAPPELAVTFGLDLTDNKKVAELGAGDVKTTVDGTANLDLLLKTDLASKLLPSLSTDLVIQYNIANYDAADGSSGAGTTPNIALNHITLNLGSFVGFLAGAFSPIIDKVFGAFPIAPVIDVLTTPIPIIDPALHALGLAGNFDAIGNDDIINLLDIAAQFGGDPEVLNAFATAFNLIKGFQAATSNGSDTIEIDMGSITLAGDAPVNAMGKSISQFSGTASDYHAPTTNPFDATNKGLADTLSGSPPPSNGMGGLTKPLSDALLSAGISVPLLTHPENILPLLLNGDGGGDAVTLIEYDVPALVFKARYENFFPVIGPIGIGIGGELHAGLDVNFGYDTYGIAHNLGFETGFYFTTAKLEHKETINKIDLYFEPVATVGVELDASAQVNVGFAKLAIGGGVGADLSAFFPDAQLDPTLAGNENAGKLRLANVTDCLLDPIAGQVKAMLFLDFEINFIFFSFQHRFDLADVTLAEFSFGCCTPETDPGFGLGTLINATLDGGGHYTQQLQLNGGLNAGNLYINGEQQEDTSESFEVRNAHDSNGIVIAGAYEITSHTITNAYDGVGVPIKQIVAEMGDERDVVVIAKDVMIGATISGGAGDDLLVGGAGDDTLDGGDDYNHLIGGDGNDKLIGGDKDDVLEGGLGADSLDGGSGGIDQVSYEHSLAGVHFKVDKDDSDIFRGTGGEAQGDVLTDIEYLIGSHFNDTLYANPDEQSTIEGLDGNDVLIGGDEEDYLIGGAGADALIGGDGTDGDGTSYLTSAAGVVVNLTTGKGSGGDAQGDTYFGIEHVQGSSSDDVITGSADDNVDNIIDGWYGDDQISGGGGGDDELGGGAGNDTIFSTDDGDDKLDGGVGRDLLSYERSTQGVVANLYGDDNTKEQYNDAGSDNIARVLVSSVKISVDPDPAKYDNTYAAHISTFEDLTGSKFDDTLAGDDKSNVIKGLGGVDHIDGMGGNDTLIGGAGGDAMDGGSGFDLADYRDATGAINVSLESFVAGLGAEAAGDHLTAIENLRGSDFSDVLSGDGTANDIDPGLARSILSDLVNGGAGNDTLILDYSRGGTTKGMVGGFDPGSVSGGSFTRAESASAAQRDGVVFVEIERLNVTGTAHDDVIFGAWGNDLITTGSGNDIVFAGLGIDRVFAGKGNDIVVAGTDADRLLSSTGGTDMVELVGGAGVDGLSISLAASTENIHLAGTSGLGDYNGVNLALKNGTGISQFEVLLAVATGRGDDTLSQPGNFDNFFATGYGVDGIKSGLGKDYVDGGLEFRIGKEIAEPDPSGGLVPVKSIDVLYANDGDLLILDYSGLADAVFGSVQTTGTAFTVLDDGGVSHQLLTNNGHYQAGANSVDFVNIERLDVTGSQAGDLLIGTNLLLGRNIASNGEIIASTSRRGDDHLSGGLGSDLLIGNTGDDTLSGDAGDDVLVGAAVGTGRGAVVDRGEIDTLTGGDGADTFVLGTVIGENSIVYYNDGTGAAVGLNAVGDRTQSGDNSAEITDFSSSDFIQLAGIHSDYKSVSIDGNTRIYLRDGVDGDGNAYGRADELIAVLTGVAEFDLGAAYVKYVGTSALASEPVKGVFADIDVGGGIARIDATDAATQAIVDRLADVAHAAEPDAMAQARAVETVPVALAQPSQQQLAASLPVVASGSGEPAWVTQTDDITTLRTALFGTGTPFSQGKLTIEGDASAFGTFDGDPFGLGHGIILSTGAVEDVAGKNLIDGGKTIGASTELTFVKIGRVGGDLTGNDIYRADLSNLGYDLNSITLGDHSAGFGGGSGDASGFDISAIVLSHTRLDSVEATTDLNATSVLPRIDAFSFDAANAQYTPGTQRPGEGGFTNAVDLRGAVNGMPTYGKDTLDSFDFHYLTLGDGGSLGLNLTQTVATKGPLYLYVAENGGTGEELTTGFKASSSRLDTPADLSTDLGAPGVEGDSASLTYRFTPVGNKDVPDPSITKVTFDFVFFSEELVEYAQSEFNDNFKITLNGVNLALLTDGSSASVNTLYTPNASGSASSSIFTLREDTIVSDFIYNPVGTGPTAAMTRADGYSKVLHFTGDLIPGAENVLRFEVNDVRDGLLDSGILIRGGSFIGESVTQFFVDPITTPIAEGQHHDIAFGLKVPTGGHADAPVTVTFHATAGLDLGAGAGHDVTRVVGPNGTLTDVVTATAVFDGADDGSRYEIVTVDLAGNGPHELIAPLVIEVTDSLVALSRTIGDAPVRYDRMAPNAWAKAWTAEGIHITHTADTSARAPVYSAVDFGTANAKLLSGSDILAGDLGVSGQAKGAPGGIQDIAGTEALRFEFDSDDVAGFSLDFARFDRGDTARIELHDASGALVRSVTSSAATFGLADLHGIASIIVSAASGAFMIDSLSVTEMVPESGSHMPISSAAFGNDHGGLASIAHFVGGGGADLHLPHYQVV